MGARLVGHDHDVIGKAKAMGWPPAGRQRILDALEVVGPRGGHQVERVGAEPTALWPAQVIRQRHRDYLALTHQLGCGGHLLRPHQVQGSKLIVVPPAAPVRVPGDVVANDLLASEPGACAHRGLAHATAPCRSKSAVSSSSAGLTCSMNKLMFSITDSIGC